MGEVVLGVVVVAIVIAAFKLAAKQQKEIERKERLSAEKKLSRHKLRAEANILIANIKKTAKHLPSLVVAAEEKLDVAEQKFAGGYFAPFWGAIEDAIVSLGDFDRGVHQIKDMAKRATSCTKIAGGKKVSSSVSIQSLPDPRIATARLARVVEAAQREPMFAQIYELRQQTQLQRQTNQILVQGFNNLTDAINDIGPYIDRAIGELCDTITVGFAQQNAVLVEAVSGQTEALEAGLSGLDDSIRTHGKERSRHEKSEREILDNMQRRRKPPRNHLNTRRDY